jgi:hypothetical protein
MLTAAQIFGGIGRMHKLALARRDRRLMDRLLGGLDRIVCEDVLARCDKYAADMQRRGKDVTP